MTLFHWGGGTNGTPVNLAALTNSSTGAGGTWLLSNPTNIITFTNFAYKPLLGTANLTSGGIVDGTTAAGVGFVIGDDNQTYSKSIYFYPSNSGGFNDVNTNLLVASTGIWVSTDLALIASGAQHDLFNLKGDKPGLAGGGDFVQTWVNNRNNLGWPTPIWGLESHNYGFLNMLTYETNYNWYWVTCQMHFGESNRIAYYSTNNAGQFVLLGQDSCANDGLSYPHIVQWFFQNDNGKGPGMHVWYGSGLADFDQGIFPLLPSTATPIASRTGPGRPRKR